MMKKTKHQVIAEIFTYFYFSFFLGYIAACLINDGYFLPVSDLASIASASSAIVVAWIAFIGIHSYKKQGRFNLELEAARTLLRSSIDSHSMKFGLSAEQTIFKYRDILGRGNANVDDKQRIIESLIEQKKQIDQFSNKLKSLKPEILLLSNYPQVLNNYDDLLKWSLQIKSPLIVSNQWLYYDKMDACDQYDEIKTSLNGFLTSNKDDIKNLYNGIIHEDTWNSLYDTGFTKADKLINSICESVLPNKS